MKSLHRSPVASSDLISGTSCGAVGRFLTHAADRRLQGGSKRRSLTLQHKPLIYP